MAVGHTLQQQQQQQQKADVCMFDSKQAAAGER